MRHPAPSEKEEIATLRAQLATAKREAHAMADAVLAEREGTEPIGCPTPGACSCPPATLTAREGADAQRDVILDDLIRRLDLSSAQLATAQREAHVLATTWQTLRDDMVAAHGRALEAAEARGRALEGVARARLVKLDAWLASEWRTMEVRTRRADDEEERDALRAALLQAEAPRAPGGAREGT